VGPPPLETTTSQPVEDDASHLVIPAVLTWLLG
jgi:hypothetical protein